jgi:hypothetical protein
MPAAVGAFSELVNISLCHFQVGPYPELLQHHCYGMTSLVMPLKGTISTPSSSDHRLSPLILTFSNC